MEDAGSPEINQIDPDVNEKPVELPVELMFDHEKDHVMEDVGGPVWHYGWSHTCTLFHLRCQHTVSKRHLSFSLLETQSSSSPLYLLTRSLLGTFSSHWVYR